MDNLIELPDNTDGTEHPKIKTSSPPEPEIETPVPPQVMNPSIPPDMEVTKPSPAKRKRINLKNYVKIDNKQRLEKNTPAWS